MKKLPTIGNMRDRVVIQERTISRGATGATETWSTTETRWASVVAIPTGKKVFLGADYKNVTHEIYFRGHLSYAIEGTRFYHDSKYYYIKKPAEHTDSGRQKFTKFVVREAISS